MTKYVILVQYPVAPEETHGGKKESSKRSLGSTPDRLSYLKFSHCVVVTAVDDEQLFY